MLHASKDNRRVGALPENANKAIVLYIEENAKIEDTAEDLVIDNKTGKMRHIAEPTSPEEQFQFMMIKQAIARHYWLQERGGQVLPEAEKVKAPLVPVYPKLEL